MPPWPRERTMRQPPTRSPTWTGGQGEVAPAGAEAAGGGSEAQSWVAARPSSLGAGPGVGWAPRPRSERGARQAAHSSKCRCRAARSLSRSRPSKNSWSVLFEGHAVIVIDYSGSGTVLTKGPLLVGLHLRRQLA